MSSPRLHAASTALLLSVWATGADATRHRIHQPPKDVSVRRAIARLWRELSSSFCPLATPGQRINGHRCEED